MSDIQGASADADQALVNQAPTGLGPTGFDPSRYHMRETKHVNGGREWFGYEHQCVEEPRLRRFDRYVRKDRSVLSTWRVDGDDCLSFGEALELLSSPPHLTVAELDMLAKFNAPVMSKRDFGDFSEAYPVLRSLDAKGLTWWEDGKVRLRHAAALVAIGSVESNASGTPSWDAIGPRATVARTAVRDSDGSPKGGDGEAGSVHDSADPKGIAHD